MKTFREFISEDDANVAKIDPLKLQAQAKTKRDQVARKLASDKNKRDAEQRHREQVAREA